MSAPGPKLDKSITLKSIFRKTAIDTNTVLKYDNETVYIGVVTPNFMWFKKTEILGTIELYAEALVVTCDKVTKYGIVASYARRLQEILEDYGVGDTFKVKLIETY